MCDGRETGCYKDQPDCICSINLFQRGKTGREGILGWQEVPKEVSRVFSRKNRSFLHYFTVKTVLL